MSKPLRIVMPTDEEEEAINAGIAADPDTYELSDEQFALLRPLTGELPGSPASVSINLNLDVRMVQALQTVGADWEELINTILKDWLVNHGTVSHPR